MTFRVTRWRIARGSASVQYFRRMLKGFRGAWLRGTRDPLQAALGPLERAVMDTIWRGGDLSVREVQGQLANPAAYTTVMTTLDRLFKKGLVHRRRDGRAFLYTAALERHELETTNDDRAA